mgnify:CR=1 FL=1
MPPCIELIQFDTNAAHRSYVLSHIKDLTYFDYRRVAAADMSAAMEKHQVRRRRLCVYQQTFECVVCASVYSFVQNEIIEVHDREEQAASEAQVAAHRKQHEDLMLFFGMICAHVHLYTFVDAE